MKKIFGVPLTENAQMCIKYLGPIVAVAALQIGYGIYSEASRPRKVETAPATAQAPTTDMPIPTYRWVAPLRQGVEDLSKGSEYTGQ